MSGEENTTAAPGRAANDGPAIKALLFFLVLFSCAYVFHPDPCDNVMNRMDVVYSIVYGRTLQIDRYGDNTIDKAFYKGHYYYSEAVGSVPAGVFALSAYRLLSGDNNPDPYNAAALYVITFLLVSLPAAALAVLLFGFLGKFSGAVLSRLAVVGAFSFGTLAFPYSTLYYNYIPALLLCFCALLMVDRADSGGGFSPARLFLIGLLISYAAITQYDTAIIGAAIGVWTLARLDRKFSILWLIAGAAPPLCLLGAYNYLCFETPFTLGLMHLPVSSDPKYNYVAQSGSLGATFPNPAVALKLLFEPARGIFWLSPFLVFSVPGFVRFFRKKEWRAHAWVFLAVSVSYIVFNSSFINYNGGADPGPRYLTAGMLFMCVPALFFLDGARRIWKVIYGALAGFAAFGMICVTLTGPHVPANILSPLYSVGLPLFAAGPGAWSTRNIGQAMWLSGFVSLLPAAVALGALAVSIYFVAVRQNGFGRAARYLLYLPFAAAAVGAVCFSGMRLSRSEAGEAGMYRGRVYAAHGLYGRAIREFDAAAARKETRAAALAERAIALDKTGDVSGALRDLRELLALHPGDIYARGMYAQMLRARAKDEAAADEQYRLLLRAGRGLPAEIAFAAHMSAGAEDERAGRLGAALSHYRAAGAIYPREASPALSGANLLIGYFNRTGDAGKLDEAEELLRRAAAMDTSNVAPRETLLGVYIARKKYADALRTAVGILKMDSGNKAAQRFMDVVKDSEQKVNR